MWLSPWDHSEAGRNAGAVSRLTSDVNSDHRWRARPPEGYRALGQRVVGIGVDVKLAAVISDVNSSYLATVTDTRWQNQYSWPGLAGRAALAERRDTSGFESLIPKTGR